ncbi:class I SAM-dependent methyltransferase [Mangrovimonas xylaniphaga]|uniref:class I SAM-dependent methyltransferase n=1 Tax=Mangrovimonas xylaniphaga TaxID=1645915 RepID=UPI0006B53064|nr:class I SAM-dependent methyltransferase [Mangrovimonas xylaniphaga]
MITLFKNIIPLSAKKVYWRYLKKQKKAKRRRVKFDGKTAKETFTYIYETNHWSGKESISGGGSDPWHTRVIVEKVSGLIEDLQINSVLDLPCGDFAWVKDVDLGDAKYVGGDIVAPLILKNNEVYGARPNVSFTELDLLKDSLPKMDLLINRDCLVHLSFSDIALALRRIKSSGCKYLLTTTYPDHDNKDITTGDWRPLNMEKAPFNFGRPVKLIDEQLNKTGLRDKSLGLWEVSNIDVFEFEKF